MRLFLLLVAVPVIEIALFIEVGGVLGTWPTVGIVILTALIGSVLLRQQGLKALGDIQGRLMSGDDPGRLLADGAMILVAGALLLTPGFFTDAVGFLLLVPQVRAIVYHWIRRNMSVRMQARSSFSHEHQAGHTSQTWHDRDGQTVDGDYEDITPGGDAPRDGARRPLE